MLVEIIIVVALLYTVCGACRYARKHIDASNINRRSNRCDPKPKGEVT